ncbi:hypothetical protein [Neisseria dentiae]|uniref:hypothetical protein n=1 Tax=Neisseria dentiae TaxID=194197 RepID=UPI0035A10B26
MFDPADLQPNGNFLPLTNFYFDHPAAQTDETHADFYFVGSHLPQRSGVIAEFGHQARAHGWMLDFNIVCSAKEEKACRALYPDNIKLSTLTADYAENLQHAAQAKVLVDFKTPVHNGLRPLQKYRDLCKIKKTSQKIYFPSFPRRRESRRFFHKLLK